MHLLAISVPLGGVIISVLALMGCMAFDRVVPSEVEVNDHASLVILPFGFDVILTKVAYPLEEALSPDEESTRVAEARRSAQSEARCLFLSRLIMAQGFRMISLEESDALPTELEMAPAFCRPVAQVTAFRRRLATDTRSTYEARSKGPGGHVHPTRLHHTRAVVPGNDSPA